MTCLLTILRQWAGKLVQEVAYLSNHNCVNEPELVCASVCVNVRASVHVHVFVCVSVYVYAVCGSCSVSLPGTFCEVGNDNRCLLYVCGLTFFFSIN